MCYEDKIKAMLHANKLFLIISKGVENRLPIVRIYAFCKAYVNEKVDTLDFERRIFVLTSTIRVSQLNFNTVV